MLKRQDDQWIHVDKKGKKTPLPKMATPHIKKMIQLCKKYVFTFEYEGEFLFEEDIYCDELKKRSYANRIAHELNKSFSSKIAE